ncbi:hypothetical protein FACS1894141_5770 [Spirochaetia bacterium]|nr:hypothetical protein FACS1894141_5770 [Spirochaetia bacterium]
MLSEKNENLLKFAIRTILIYEQNVVRYTNYEFSLISGAVLNVLSSVYDGKKIVTELRAILTEKFPGVEPRNARSLKIEIQRLQQALSAKTGHYNIDKEDKEIAYIKIQSAFHQVDKTYKLTDLQKIFMCLKESIHDTYLAIYENEEIAFNHVYKTKQLSC